MVGQTLLGKYNVTRLLDEGGMSRVYLARQLDQDREVAVKVLKDGLLAKPKTREHFRREIHITSQFHHPNAVAYYDSGQSPRYGSVLVMEYLRGLDLGVLLVRGGRLTPERAGRILAQLCDVLQTAHGQGIVHRDIKPGNLMILYPNTPQETVKLMDFGLAQMSSMLYISPDDLVDPLAATTAGTPEYMAPEQVHGDSMDGRGDLYSVGVVLYEMLSGRRPFAHASAQGLLNAHAAEQAPSFAALGLSGVIPPLVEVVVRSCLAKSPERRPQSAAELAQRYEQALGRKLSTVMRRPAIPAGPAPATPPASQASTAPVRAIDRHAVQHRFEVTMPEAMAMLKLKGFIHDLGGVVIESVPGLIRVRLAASQSNSEAKKKKGGLFGWMERDQPTTSVLESMPPTDLELRMERPEPGQSNRLLITLFLRSATTLITPEWRRRCSQLGRDLQSYLMGR